MLVCLWWQQSNASEDQQKDFEKQRGTPQDRWPWGVSFFWLPETLLSNYQSNDLREVMCIFKLVFRAKVNKYGDRLLETIESTINEYNVTNKKGFME